MSSLRRPPLDPEIAKIVDIVSGQIPSLEPLTPEVLGQIRAAPVRPGDTGSPGVERRDLTIPGYGGVLLELSVFAPTGHTGHGPGIVYIHGGGMIAGNRFTALAAVLPWVREHGAVLASIEYRLAPEHEDPIPLEDCYASLLWVAEHADELGIDRERLLLVGRSAGGGLAAGTALLARDRATPALIGQMLLCPMIDDRDQTVSTMQFDGLGVWERQSNRAGWRALLGARRATFEVSVYSAPSRAEDLSGLPPTYIDVGSADVFRDEDVAYASQLWADGGDAELHVWPGATHGWEALVPGSSMLRRATDARDQWLRRLLR